MDFLISAAHAQAAQPQQPDLFSGLFLPMIFLAVVFYLLIIRPQSKRTKEHKSMLGDLAKGDEIATTGGLIGKVVKIGENFIEIQVADEVNVRIQKHAVANLMPKGTLKSQD